MSVWVYMQKNIIAKILAHVFERIMSVIDIVLTKMANTISTNVSIYPHSKNVRYKTDCDFLHTVFLVVILLLIITLIYYHYAKHGPKQKGIDALTISSEK